MPTVPTYDSPQVQNAPLPGARQTASPSAGALGASVGQGLQRAAGTMADVYQQEKVKADKSAVLKATNQLSTASMGLEQNVLQQKGENAFGADASAMDAFTGTASSIRDNLTNDEQRMAFDAQAMQWGNNLKSTVERHVAQQRDAIYDEQANVALENARQSAAQDYVNPDRIAQSLIDQYKVLADTAQRKGWSKDILAAKQKDEESKVHIGVISSMLADQNYGLAKKYFDAHGDGIADPAQRAKVKTIVQDGGRQTDGVNIANDVLSSKRYGVDVATAVNRAYAMTDDPKVQAYAKQRIVEHFSLAEAADAQRKKDAFDRATKIVTSSKSTDGISADLRSMLSPGQQEALGNLATYLIKGPPKVNDVHKWTEYMALEPDQRAKVDPLTELRPYLDDRHYDAALSDIRAIREGKGAAADVITYDKMFKDTIARSGLVPINNPKKMTEEDKTRYQILHDKVALRIAAEQEGGKKLTMTEKQKIVDDEVINHVVRIKEWSWGSGKRKAAGELTPDEIPKAYTDVGELKKARPSYYQNIKNLIESHGKVANDDLVQRIATLHALGDANAVNKLLSDK